MFCKKAIALLAVAAVGLVAPTMAVARNGGGGGGGHGGGFHDGGSHDHDFDHHFGWNYGSYPYGYSDSYAYYDNNSCSIIQRRVYTTYGWRTRSVPVC